MPAMSANNSTGELSDAGCSSFRAVAQESHAEMTRRNDTRSTSAANEMRYKTRSIIGGQCRSAPQLDHSVIKTDQPTQPTMLTRR